MVVLRDEGLRPKRRPTVADLGTGPSPTAGGPVRPRRPSPIGYEQWITPENEYLFRVLRQPPAGQPSDWREGREHRQLRAASPLIVSRDIASPPFALCPPDDPRTLGGIRSASVSRRRPPAYPWEQKGRIIPCTNAGEVYYGKIRGVGPKPDHPPSHYHHPYDMQPPKDTRLRGAEDEEQAYQEWLEQRLRREFELHRHWQSEVGARMKRLCPEPGTHGYQQSFPDLIGGRRTPAMGFRGMEHFIPTQKKKSKDRSNQIESAEFREAVCNGPPVKYRPAKRIFPPNPYFHPPPHSPPPRANPVFASQLQRGSNIPYEESFTGPDRPQKRLFYGHIAPVNCDWLVHADPAQLSQAETAAEMDRRFEMKKRPGPPTAYHVHPLFLSSGALPFRPSKRPAPPHTFADRVQLATAAAATAAATGPASSVVDDPYKGAHPLFMRTPGPPTPVRHDDEEQETQQREGLGEEREGENNEGGEDDEQEEKEEEEEEEEEGQAQDQEVEGLVTAERPGPPTIDDLGVPPSPCVEFRPSYAYEHFTPPPSVPTTPTRRRSSGLPAYGVSGWTAGTIARVH
ncbi:unnamed protein product [Vitrella brassicaformis CCMP3155]|uniref:Uncharacterized protein n=1 Tax=Vitrella brassicaformis (strain CCMP3155) TaxID=1169540 RepID=A0A0G4GUC8_VITBC|nr:unnamed protein product [Vitrella brassicaformis CCMP3155]|eukprot:CEM34411.1 unnamed protein product [Vitrella brassicaformis CCMP3155]